MCNKVVTWCEKNHFQKCTLGLLWTPPLCVSIFPVFPVITGLLVPDYQRNAANREKEGKKNSISPKLLPALVNHRSCVMGKHTSAGWLRSLTLPAATTTTTGSRAESRVSHNDLLNLENCNRHKLRPVFHYLASLAPAADIKFTRHPVGGSITSSALWTPGQRASPPRHIPAHTSTTHTRRFLLYKAQKKLRICRGSRDAEQPADLLEQKALKDGAALERGGKRPAGGAGSHTAGMASWGAGQRPGQGRFACRFQLKWHISTLGWFKEWGFSSDHPHFSCCRFQRIPNFVYFLTQKVSAWSLFFSHHQSVGKIINVASTP